MYQVSSRSEGPVPPWLIVLAARVTDTAIAHVEGLGPFFSMGFQFD
jgi:hypothetical protein